MGMFDADASHALSSPQIAGTWVNPKGLAKKMVGGAAGREIAGAMGQIAAEATAKRGSHPSPETPEFGKIGFLAVSDSEVALVKGKQGAWKAKVTDEVLARHARTDVTSAELGSGKLALPLTITFNSGETWRFDIARAAKKYADHVVSALGG
jgi:hypothetical protein